MAISNSDTLKDRVYKFLKENPEALENNIIKKYTRELGISKTTYLRYKGEYEDENKFEIEENRQDCNRSDNGIIREKFEFDDSRLWRM